jgi:hypothetical protein
VAFVVALKGSGLTSYRERSDPDFEKRPAVWNPEAAIGARVATNAPPHRLTAGPELETLFATQALSMACQARLQRDLDTDRAFSRNRSRVFSLALMFSTPSGSAHYEIDGSNRYPHGERHQNFGLYGGERHAHHIVGGNGIIWRGVEDCHHHECRRHYCDGGCDAEPKSISPNHRASSAIRSTKTNLIFIPFIFP